MNWEEELRQFRDAEDLAALIHRLECHGAPEAVILFAKRAAELILAATDRAECAEGALDDNWHDGYAGGHADAIAMAIEAIKKLN